jgi:hypothetical protein
MTAPRQPSGAAVGWAYFASVILIIVGCFQAIAGIVGIAKDEFYVTAVGPNAKWVFSLDATQWGWIHLIIGIVLVLAGIGILSGNILARTIGVIVAGISAIANFMWLPYQPFWAIIMIIVDVTVIWALTAHGRDITEI